MPTIRGHKHRFSDFLHKAIAGLSGEIVASPINKIDGACLAPSATDFASSNNSAKSCGHFRVTVKLTVAIISSVLLPKFLFVTYSWDHVRNSGSRDGPAKHISRAPCFAKNQNIHKILKTLRQRGVDINKREMIQYLHRTQRLGSQWLASCFLYRLCKTKDFNTGNLYCVRRTAETNSHDSPVKNLLSLQAIEPLAHLICYQVRRDPTAGE